MSNPTSRAAELESFSPSYFSAIRRANREMLAAYAMHPIAYPTFAEDTVLIEAEVARRIELNRTAGERMDACVREMNAETCARRAAAEEAEERAMRFAA